MDDNKDNHQVVLGDVKISLVGNTEVVWDVVRMKNIVLTPEELVRQRMVHYLHDFKGYPISHIGIEKAILFNKRRKRVDMIVYDDHGSIKMIVELKAPSVKLDQKTISQIASYNFTLQVDFLVLSNGKETFCFKIDKVQNTIIQMKEIPHYQEL